MQWRSAGEVKWLEARLPGSVAVFSTRSCGSAKESHIPLATALEISPDLIVSGHQAHGAELAFHEVAVAGIPRVDRKLLTKPGPVRLVHTADCLPVALAPARGVAAARCGLTWHADPIR